MSMWTRVVRGEMELSDDKETIEILIDSDTCGNNYLEIKVSDLLEIMPNQKEKI